MKNKIINALKLFVMMFAMTMGFLFIYMTVWHCFAELTAVSIGICALLACASEFGYIWWIVDKEV